MKDGAMKCGRTLGFLSLVVSLVMGLPGCAPVTTHSPVVHPGWSSGVTLSAGVQAPEEDAGFFPGLSVFVRHGWQSAADSTRAYLLGAQIAPILLLVGLQPELLSRAVELDGYAQLRRAPAGGTDHGVGVVASRVYVMPYLQFGRRGAGGSGWYTTQGVGISRADGGTLFWAPGLAWQNVSASGDDAVHFFLNAFVGGGPVPETGPLSMILIGGLSIEVRRLKRTARGD